MKVNFHTIESKDGFYCQELLIECPLKRAGG